VLLNEPQRKAQHKFYISLKKAQTKLYDISLKELLPTQEINPEKTHPPHIKISHTFSALSQIYAQDSQEAGSLENKETP
jgi:hypothetical protein